MLAVEARPAAERELAELRAFAAANGHDGELQLWDSPFWSERLREETFSFTEEELRPYVVPTSWRCRWVHSTSFLEPAHAARGSERATGFVSPAISSSAPTPLPPRTGEGAAPPTHPPAVHQAAKRLTPTPPRQVLCAAGRARRALRARAAAVRRDDLARERRPARREVARRRRLLHRRGRAGW